MNARVDSPLKVNLKTAVAGLAIFGAIVLLYTQGILALERASGGSLNARAMTMIDYLPQITAVPEDEKLVMFYGSSMVQAGFDPLVFDDVMNDAQRSVRSYNYGLGNLNPQFQEILSRRIREVFERDERRLSLALIEFNPFQTTIARSESTHMMDEQNTAILSSNAELWNATLADPSSGVRMFVIRYFRKGYSAELITSLPQLAGASGPQLSAEQQAQYREAEQHRSELLQEYLRLFELDNHPESELPGWDPALRGGRINRALLSSATQEALQRYLDASRHPLRMQRDLQRRIETADILNLEFDEASIRAFIEIVRNFQAISDNVEVVLLPRHTQFVNYSPRVQERLDAVKQRIGRGAGVIVRDQQMLPGIGPQHFGDSTHLDSFGAQTYSRSLAQSYLEML